MNKYLFLMIFSFNTFAAAIETGKEIKAVDLNDKLNELYQVYYKNGVEAHNITSASKVDVNSRSLNFVKKHDSTKLVMTYNDVFRVLTTEKMCTIYLEVDGKSCTNGQIYKSVYVYNSTDINSIEIEGVCEGITKGTHAFKIKAKADSHLQQHAGFRGGTCEFSWGANSTYSMIIKEVQN